MLDCEGYPNAFLESKYLKLEMYDAKFKNDALIASVKIIKNKKVLFVVAHPDDEILGPGATIYQLVKHQNCIVKVIILGEGITSRSEKRDTSKWKKELKIHKSNIEKAKSILGYQYIKIYDFPDNRFDTVPLLDIVKIIENEKNDFRPDFLFTHHGGDLNIDHQKTFEAVTSSRPLQTKTYAH